jgi:uncharacterized protein
MLAFEWNDAKAELNRRKHGIGFADAVKAFGDPNLCFLEDNALSYGEVRMIALGLSGLELLTIVFTERGDVTRIISARRSTKEEQRIYARSYQN